ncbi:hypothetical protein GCK32_006593 [Trichostrongylus colubriformis]|uniref:Uncharacterized protein n=1 Tax=Trichostrongylus colubriformis TaxID=6319 RepID=A0AAN8IU50_TRICO
MLCGLKPTAAIKLRAELRNASKMKWNIGGESRTCAIRRCHLVVLRVYCQFFICRSYGMLYTEVKVGADASIIIESFCPEKETSCSFQGYNTAEKLTYDERRGCLRDDGRRIREFDNEKSLSEIIRGDIFCYCKNSSICATQPETFEKLKAVTKDIGERRAAELVANWLRTGAIAIKGKDTLPDFRTTTVTPTTITDAVTTSVKSVTYTTEISTIALKSLAATILEYVLPTDYHRMLPMVGLGVLCLILIAVIIALVMRIRGMQKEKADLEGGARTIMKDPKSSGPSEVKSASTGIKSAGSGSTDKTAGSKESGSTEKAGPKSVTGGKQIRSKE